MSSQPRHSKLFFTPFRPLTKTSRFASAAFLCEQYPLRPSDRPYDIELVEKVSSASEEQAPFTNVHPPLCMLSTTHRVDEPTLSNKQ